MSTAAYADYEALVEPHRRELQAHCYRMLGSVQDAEDALQDALLRAWKALDRFEGRSSTAQLAVPDRDQRVPGRARAPPEARAADRLRRRAAGGDALAGAVPGRARRGLRAAREHRAGVHRRAPAPAAQPARGADPARGARLQRQGGRGDARHDARLGQQRDAARARLGRRAPARALAAGDARARSTTTRSRRWSSATWTRGTAATSTPSSRCWPRRRRSRCRRTPSGSAAARRSASSCRRARCRSRASSCPRAPTASSRSAPTS